jgi:hypothetical protein
MARTEREDGGRMERKYGEEGWRKVSNKSSASL